MAQKNKNRFATNISVTQYAVEIDGKSFEVAINNENAFTSVSDRKRSLQFQIFAAGHRNQYAVVHGKNHVVVFVEKSGDSPIVHLGCRTIPAVVKSERDLLRERFRKAIKTEEIHLQIESPLPGLITSVKVQRGANVRKGESILIIEAMKMENEIRAPRDCTVLDISVREGQVVDKGDVLALLE